MGSKRLSRRQLLAGAAGAAGAAALAQSLGAQAPAAGDPTKVPGQPLSEVGRRAPSEHPRRLLSTTDPRLSVTPLQDLDGIITPSDLHYVVTHGGVPQIDPHAYKLLIHGMVERPTVFDLAALRRFHATSRLHFRQSSGKSPQE
jgi:sulfane dehydrogenase subunit SoxC